MSHWRNLHWPSDNDCDATKVSGEIAMISKVTILDMSGSFFILGVGCTVALIIFGSEIICSGGKFVSEREKNIVKPFVT